MKYLADSCKNCIVENEDGSQTITITKSSVNDDYRLFDFRTYGGDPLASLIWMGKALSDGEQIFQPAIVTNVSGETINLSYDGYANNIGGSDLITMPSDGSKYEISPPKPYYFNNIDPAVYNPAHSLLLNNQSIKMMNVSIFKGDYLQGVMVELRASMEGSISGVNDNGYVVINLKIITIN